MSNDTLKTAKRTIQKHEQAHDGHHDKHVKAAKRKERQICLDYSRTNG
jgi:hypothetical protein